MILDDVNNMIMAAKARENIVVVGAGKKLTNLLALLRTNDISVSEIFDNNEALIGTIMDGLEVKKPYRLQKDTMYIIDVKSEKARDSIKNQLLDVGISDADIMFQPIYSVEPNINLENRDKVKEAIDGLYCERFGRFINWKNPKTYNEIINCEKIYDRDPRKTRLADKYLVREFVKDTIGEQYLISLLGSWKNPEEIDFDKLPNKFVLKTNNGSGRNIIVTDKGKMDSFQVREKLGKWMDSDYWMGLLEYQYKDIPPVILCEEYIENLDIDCMEFKFYCFHGKVKYIGCEKNNHLPGWSGIMYDRDWNKQDFSYATPIGDFDIIRPQGFNEMISVCEKLSKDFRHVRVDLYEMKQGKILFGEMTFSSWGGMKHFVPEFWDEKFGELI